MWTDTEEPEDNGGAHGGRLRIFCIIEGVENMGSIKLKKREIPLAFTVLELKQMQEEIAPISELNNVIFAINKDDPADNSAYATTEHLNAVAKMIRIMGNAGLEEAGEAPDLTEREIMRALKPSDIWRALKACMAVMTEGMVSEIPEENSDEPVDVTLEEINKKKERDG